MSDGWKMKDGKAPYLRRLKNLGRTKRVYGVKVGTGSTHGTVRRKKLGDRSDERSAGDNIIAIRQNAKKGRDVTGVSNAERAAGQRIWDKATSDYLRTGSAKFLRSASAEIGSLLIAAYKKHIRTGVGADGPLRPVKQSTQKRKDREARPGLPPMHRTGQLLRAFIARVIER